MTDYNDLFCLECKHFYFSEGWPGYSEHTPGYGASMDCQKHHWEIDLCKESKTGLYIKLRLARGCTDFEQDNKLPITNHLTQKE